jgi:aminoglycoside phosphotransferase (APT) family kinase protein
MPQPADQIQARAEALWPQIAAELGVPVADASFRRLPVNSSRQHWRSVLEIKLPQGERFVLRADFDGCPPSPFAAILARHRAAVAGLKSEPGVSAPAILWQDREHPYYLMEFASGDTALRALHATEYGLGDRAAVLQNIGQAVAALHRVSGVGRRQFWPKPFLTRISERARAVRSGQVELPKPHKFLGLCALLHRLGRAARGQDFDAALEHGDLHLRNILLCEDTTCFIDFANHRGIFPQRDLATLWLANCPDHLAQEGRAPGYGLVAQADWAAFQQGYGRDLENDPVFRFFFARRLFKSWVMLAQKPRSPDPQAIQRAERLAEIYLQVFNALRAAE